MILDSAVATVVHNYNHYWSLFHECRGYLLTIHQEDPITGKRNQRCIRHRNLGSNGGRYAEPHGTITSTQYSLVSFSRNQSLRHTSICPGPISNNRSWRQEVTYSANQLRRSTVTF